MINPAFQYYSGQRVVGTLYVLMDCDSAAEDLDLPALSIYRVVDTTPVHKHYNCGSACCA